ncbi:MAG: transposase [Paracoccus sp. (in: a-proteobacteria)]
MLVLDNASFHKRSDTEKLIAGAGHTLEYLPPYSPDLNKIKPIRAQAKAIRRRTGLSVDELFSCKNGIKIKSLGYRPDQRRHEHQAACDL